MDRDCKIIAVVESRHHRSVGDEFCEVRIFRSEQPLALTDIDPRERRAKAGTRGAKAETKPSALETLIKSGQVTVIYRNRIDFLVEVDRDFSRAEWRLLQDIKNILACREVERRVLRDWRKTTGPDWVEDIEKIMTKYGLTD